ncbi:SPATA6, partial [Cervus elaphus hippelaphus]
MRPVGDSANLAYRRCNAADLINITVCSLKQWTLEMWLHSLNDKFVYHTAPVEKPHGRLQNRTSRSQKKKSKSPERNKYCINAKNYEQPTISSKSHSPSPYTKRRMCELSEDTRRRLAHLNLGPYEFKKETDKPPFVIRHVDPPSPRADALFGSPGRDCERDGWSRLHNAHFNGHVALSIWMMVKLEP